MFRKLRQFRDDVAGVAAVEFALVLPVLIALYLGTVEATTIYAVDRKVTSVASTMADLVSRQKDEIALSTLNTYFTAAANIMQPFSSTELKQVVSLLQIDSSGNATVKWSRANGTGATARTADSSYTLSATSEINILARGASGYLVVAEISYERAPLTGFIFSSNINLKHVEYYLPRFEDEITLDTAS